MKALLVKMSSLGDVVHTLPAVADSASHGVRFDWVVEENLAPLVARVDGVENVLPAALRRWRRAPRAGLAEAAVFVQRLRQRQYDLLVDAQGLLKSAGISCLVRARERVGLDFDSIRERPAAVAYHRRVPIPRAAHAIRRTRQLFAAAFGYPVPDCPPRFAVDASAARSAPLRDKPRVLLAHGSTWATKDWPEPHWVALATRLVAAGMTPVVPWLGDERAVAMRLQQAVPGLQVCPPMDLGDIIDLVAGVAGVVGVDSGVAHLSAAMGRPTVMLFGPTSTALTGCEGRYVCNLSVGLGCAPCQSRRCHHPDTSHGKGAACLTALSPDIVWSALRRLMARQQATTRPDIASA